MLCSFGIGRRTVNQEQPGLASPWLLAAIPWSRVCLVHVVLTVSPWLTPCLPPRAAFHRKSMSYQSTYAVRCSTCILRRVGPYQSGCLLMRPCARQSMALWCRRWEEGRVGAWLQVPTLLANNNDSVVPLPVCQASGSSVAAVVCGQGSGRGRAWAVVCQAFQHTVCERPLLGALPGWRIASLTRG